MTIDEKRIIFIHTMRFFVQIYKGLCIKQVL
jgi:hypothetical protein